MDKKLLTIQDISCVGQCSLTVAMPIISACKIETCILPSAVLSTHTGGFTGYTFRDLTKDIPLIAAHWKKEGISFDALYTGYLGSVEQIKYVKEIADTLLKKDAPLIVDPACADNGLLYPGFEPSFIGEMKSLVAKADIAIPNITEASMLVGAEYKTKYDEKYIDDLTDKILALGTKAIVLTGVGYDDESTGVFVKTKDGKRYYYRHKKIAGGYHGTGDIYASAFCGMYLNGKSIEEAARIAADFTVKAIENTVGDENHRYGVKFEKSLGFLFNSLG